MKNFYDWHPILQALAATVGTWAVTALGALLVVFTKRLSRKYLDASLGVAAGVMVAASFWSLLAPAIDLSEHMGVWKWLPAAIGFVLGAMALWGIDKLLPHMHPGLAVAEGPKTAWQRATLLVLAITLHNIPEGLAVGVAFGAAATFAGDPVASGAQITAAIALAIGIALQNFPEGTAVALPLRREGMSRAKAFWYGQLSAVVEPAAGVLGAWAVLSMSAILPYALAFAAGAMIFVVVEELIPESQRGRNVDLATMAFVFGFVIMMTLDVAFGNT